MNFALTLKVACLKRRLDSDARSSPPFVSTKSILHSQQSNHCIPLEPFQNFPSHSAFPMHDNPVFLSGKPHGQRSLDGCSPWGCLELDVTKVT